MKESHHSREEKSRKKRPDPYRYERDRRSGSRKYSGAEHRQPSHKSHEDYGPGENYIKQKTKRKGGRMLFWIVFVELVAITCCIAFLYISRGNPDVDDLLAKDPKIAYETETELEPGMAVPRPYIDEQLLTINDWSRPGTKTDSIDKVVVHYLANPRTTAQENHDYFESLKDLQNTYMSANYVVGLNGEIIQCVPDGEVAWASNEANYYSISIENCHMTSTGKLNKATYWSDVHLVAYLTEKYKLGRDDIIRHYDVTGKNCPKWFVEHPEAWEQFKDDVMTYRSECEKIQAQALAEAKAAGIPDEDVLAIYLSENVADQASFMDETEDDIWNMLKKRAGSAIDSARPGKAEADTAETEYTDAKDFPDTLNETMPEEEPAGAAESAEPAQAAES